MFTWVWKSEVITEFLLLKLSGFSPVWQISFTGSSLRPIIKSLISCSCSLWQGWFHLWHSAPNFYSYFNVKLTRKNISGQGVCSQKSQKVKWATSWQNNKMACAPSKDSDQPAQSDQSLCCPHEEGMRPELPIERTAKILIRLGRCPGWSESSLGAQSFCWFYHEAANFNVNLTRKNIWGQGVCPQNPQTCQILLMVLNDVSNKNKHQARPVMTMSSSVIVLSFITMAPIGLGNSRDLFYV